MAATTLALALIDIALFLDSASSLYEVWLGLFTVFSGYLVPLELFPQWLQRIANVLPFRLMLGVPVEAMIGHSTRLELVRDLGWQGVYITAFALLLRTVWNAGMRRFAAFGG